jgi:hypothetical protein
VTKRFVDCVETVQRSAAARCRLTAMSSQYHTAGTKSVHAYMRTVVKKCPRADVELKEVGSSSSSSSSSRLLACMAHPASRMAVYFSPISPNLQAVGARTAFTPGREIWRTRDEPHFPCRVHVAHLSSHSRPQIGSQGRFPRCLEHQDNSDYACIRVPRCEGV